MVPKRTSPHVYVRGYGTIQRVALELEAHERSLLTRLKAWW